MIDLRLLREAPDLIRDALKKRGLDPEQLQLWLQDKPLTTPTSFDELLRREKEYRSRLAGLENDRHQLKEESEGFAKDKGSWKRASH